MTISFSGGDYKIISEYNLGFIKWDVTLAKGSLNGDKFSFATGVDWSHSFSLGGSAEAEISVSGDTIAIAVKVLGMQVYSQSESLSKIVGTKGLTLHGFNEHGVSLTNVTITIVN